MNTCGCVVYIIIILSSTITGSPSIFVLFIHRHYPKQQAIIIILAKPFCFYNLFLVNVGHGTCSSAETVIKGNLETVPCTFHEFTSLCINIIMLTNGKIISKVNKLTIPSLPLNCQLERLQISAP